MSTRKEGETKEDLTEKNKRAIAHFERANDYYRNRAGIRLVEMSPIDHIETVFTRNGGELPFQKGVKTDKYEYNALYCTLPLKTDDTREMVTYKNSKHCNKNGKPSFHRPKTFTQYLQDTYESIDCYLNLLKKGEVIVPTSTFVGNRRVKPQARELYAIVMDLDYTNAANTYINVIEDIVGGKILCPHFIVNTGNGMHLYYLLDTPIDIGTRATFKRKKDGSPVLTKTNTRVVEKQYEERIEAVRTLAKVLYSVFKQGYHLNGYPSALSAIQAYRAIGTQIKASKDVYATGFKFLDNTKPYTLEEIFEFAKRNQYPKAHLLTDDLMKVLKNEHLKPYEKKTSKEGTFKKTHKTKVIKPWKRDVYFEVLEKLKNANNIQVGVRYFRLLGVLCLLARCGFSKREAYKELKDFYDYCVEKTTPDSLDISLVSDLVEKLNTNAALAKTETLSKLLGIELKGKYKRNGNTKTEHLVLARKAKEDKGIKSIRGESKKVKENEATIKELYVDRLFSKTEISKYLEDKKINITKQTIAKVCKDVKQNKANTIFKHIGSRILRDVRNNKRLSYKKIATLLKLYSGIEVSEYTVKSCLSSFLERVKTVFSTPVLKEKDTKVIVKNGNVYALTKNATPVILEELAHILENIFRHKGIETNYLTI